jgi:hypothetical protein
MQYCAGLRGVDQSPSELGFHRAQGTIDVRVGGNTVPGLVPYIKGYRVALADGTGQIAEVRACSVKGETLWEFKSSWGLEPGVVAISEPTKVTPDSPISMSSFLTRCDGEQCETDTGILMKVDIGRTSASPEQRDATLMNFDPERGVLKAEYWAQHEFGGRNEVFLDLTWDAR